MNLKYEFTDETINTGVLLHRIRALKDFGDVKTGDLGGFIESMDNLSQDGKCWVYESGIVMENAVIEGDAKIEGIVKDSARVSGNSEVSGHAFVGSHASLNNVKMHDRSQILGSAFVSDSILRGAAHIDGDSVVRNVVLDRHAHISDTRVELSGTDKIYMKGYSFINDAVISAAINMKDDAFIARCNITKPLNLAGNAKILDERDYVALDIIAHGASAFRGSSGNVLIFIPGQSDKPVEANDFINSHSEYSEVVNNALIQFDDVQLSAEDLNFTQNDSAQML